MPNADIPVGYHVSDKGKVLVGHLAYEQFTVPLLLRFFGPIPMFLTSVIMVLLLHLFDRNVTPLVKFEPANYQNLVMKINEELTSVPRVTEHHERSDANEGQSSGAL